MALEPKSHVDSNTPMTGDAHNRVSVSLGSQSCADAKATKGQHRSRSGAKNRSGTYRNNRGSDARRQHGKELPAKGRVVLPPATFCPTASAPAFYDASGRVLRFVSRAG